MTLQPTAILFPDAELWAITYLRAALGTRSESYATDVFVSNTVPTDATTRQPKRRDRMVLVRRDGGAARGLFDRPRLGINTWAMTERDATDLARLVAALFGVASGDGVCTRVAQLGGASPIADPSGQPRRFSTFEATLRGEVLT